MSRLATVAATCLATSSLLLAGSTTAVGLSAPDPASGVVRPTGGTLQRVAPPAPAGVEAADGTLSALETVGAAGLLAATEAFRLIDTRADSEGPVGPQETAWYDLSGVGLPEGTVAVVLNVTATQATAPTSFITVLDGGAPDSVPTTSSLNSSAGRDVANLVTVPVVDGFVGLYNNAGSTHLVADLQGVYLEPTDWQSPSEGSGYVPVVPTRVLDTRLSQPLGADDHLHLDLADAPAGATAVAVTVTSTGTTAATSFVSAWPYDAAEPERAPESSVLNAHRGADVPNLAIIPLGDDGAVTLYNNQGSTHLVVDVVGWFLDGEGSAYFPVPSHRAEQSGLVGPASTVTFTALESALALPDDATAVALNLTTASPAQISYLTAYPAGTERPLASSTNARAGADVATAAITGVAITDLGPAFAVYNNAGSVYTLVDVQGYFAPAPL